MTSSFDSTPDQSYSKFWMSVVICVAVLVRGGVLLLMPEGLHRDTDGYRKIAETLRSTGTFGFPVPNLNASYGTGVDDVGVDVTHVRPTAFRPPLYPGLLTLFVTGGQLLPMAVGLLHLGCGVLTVAVVWLIAQQWGPRKSATLAALLTACDPILLNQSTQLMTETLATLAAVLALWGLTNWLRRPSTANGIFAGLLLGLACLCRPTFLPWSGLVVVSCLWVNPKGQSRWSAAVTLAVGIIVALLPWGVRNYLQFGQVKFTTTHGGYTLLLGNNPSCYRFLRESRWGSVWDSRELDQAWLRRAELSDANDDLFALTRHARPIESSRGVPTIVRTEVDDDRLAYALAQRYIREDAAMFVYSCFHRVGSLWQLLPHRISETESTGNRLLRWGTAIWYLVVFSFAIAGAWRLGGRLFRAPWLWGVLLCIAFTAVHAVFWSNMRMRAPLMPFISLLAAVGMTSLIGWRGRGGLAAAQSAEPA